MSFEKLHAHGRKLEALDHALSILRADEATNMPSGGGEKRAEAVAELAGIRHASASAPEIGEWIEAGERESPYGDNALALRELKRAYLNLTCLPTEFVSRQTATVMKTEQLWRKLHADGDWVGFAPALERVVDLVREEAALRADVLGLSPYDALIEQYDPGSRSSAVSEVFVDLKAYLKAFLPRVLENQQRRLTDRPLKTVQGFFSPEVQRALGLEMMEAVGFDFNHGRLDVSHHPFCGGVPTDVRMTTRYRTDEFMTSLMAVLHETGHALYEQGLPKEWSHWPLGDARGMGAHESQSLFVEMQLARSAEFWVWALPRVKRHIGEDVLAGWEVEDVLAHINHVETGFIRVDADEVTYPLHVILRFELEQALVTGELQIRDIPEAWDAKMQDFLGLNTIDEPAKGPMQDVHWAAGLFGYFPSYTLGAMMAAQQWAAMEKDVPGARESIARGDFEPINSWRRAKIWSQGSRYSTPDLMVEATGAPLDAEYFKSHLWKRYLG